jgi:hypothetical protein
MAGKILTEQQLEITNLSAEELVTWKAARKEAEVAKKKEELAVDRKTGFRYQPYTMGNWAVPQAPPMAAMLGQRAGQLQATPQLFLREMEPAVMAMRGDHL